MQRPTVDYSLGMNKMIDLEIFLAQVFANGRYSS